MNKIVLLTILLLGMFQNVNAQEDSTLNDVLYQPIENCEVVAVNSQNEILKLDFNKRDRIRQILNIWSEECGEAEPIQRLRILIAIYEYELEVSDYENYVLEQIEKFRDRVAIAQDEDYQDVYEEHKGYFSYVPINGTFDVMTRELALVLLPAQEEHSPSYSLALLFTEEMEAFDDEISSNNNGLYDEIESGTAHYKWSQRPRLAVEAGWWIPDTQLSKFFNSGPYLGFKGGYPFNSTWAVDFNIFVFIPAGKEPYRVNIQDSIRETRSDVFLSIGLGITRSHYFKESLAIDGSFGMGVNFTDTDIAKDEFAEELEYYSLVTFDFNLGVMLRKKISRNHSIGLSAGYHFVPYGINDRLVDVFGDQSFRLGLAYFF